MPFWRAGGVVAAASATASCQVAGGLGAAVAWLRLNACGRGRAAAGTVVVLSLRPSLALRWLSRPPNYEFPRSESRDPLVSMYASATFCQAEAQAAVVPERSRCAKQSALSLRVSLPCAAAGSKLLQRPIRRCCAAVTHAPRRRDGVKNTTGETRNHGQDRRVPQQQALAS